MKKIAVIALLLLLSACKPEVENNKETLDKIFSSDSFKFEILLQGCFGGSFYHFEAEKEEAGYLLTCKENDKSKHLSNDKVADFKALFAKLLSSKEGKNYHTTGYFSIQASNFCNAVEYDNSIEWGEFNEILKFTEIIPNP